ncbi:unnamed protein product [Acanthoscelides obtectus]|uniref:DUS-like FMN-binding domain-containing protein n=3 Tax=Acanthoscelides obtectus TaxID=200917 RepID=A0A9P0LNT2_ACAOB|nr:unnamed protein product [Acanthoscelides obtectus]CAK1672245.1 tRNA-dihydrouridine(20a/20b) synthase [NAD(P)+]-like [Acanthoscelides obtectus]
MMHSSSTVDILDLFECNKVVKICAPMVRYSKLQFRNLVKIYGCDLTFTPMILADSFCQSEKARQNEFTTNLMDTPVIVQFAANTVHDFVGAAHLVSPYCNGVDLNCGCPQRWARDLGIGCEMLKDPQKVYDIVRQCRNQIGKPLTVSVKMRLLGETKTTVEIARQLENCGVSFITVHARIPSQSVGDINKTDLANIKDSVSVPVVGNGGVTSFEEALQLQVETGCDGVMVANGILNNPALFSNTTVTFKECIQDWVNICYNSTIPASKYNKIAGSPIRSIDERPYNLTFQCFHHHLVFMLEKVLTRRQRQVFNNLKRFEEVEHFLETYFDVKPQLYEFEKFSRYACIETDYKDKDDIYKLLRPVDLIDKNEWSFYDCDNNDGKYFNYKQKELQNDECDWANIFLENG